ENTPPPETVPLVKTPVQKLTEPRECPGGAEIPLNCRSCDPLDERTDEPIVPAPFVPNIFEIAIVPASFTNVISSANAATGSARASNANTTTTRLMLIPPNTASHFP